MAFVFAALAPHSPLLLPSIGKQHTKRLAATTRGLQKLSQELYAAKPDVLVMLSTRDNLNQEGFFTPLAKNYKADLSQFGDFTLEYPVKPAVPFINSLAEDMSAAEQPYRLIPNNTISYETAIPLRLLMTELPAITIAPIYTGHRDFTAHINLGQELYKAMQKSTQRIAVIVTGYLSYTMSNLSPAGYNKSGPALVKEIKTQLSHNALNGLYSIKPKQFAAAHSSAFLPLLILAGALELVPYKSQEISYQEEFGTAFQTSVIHVS